MHEGNFCNNNTTLDFNFNATELQNDRIARNFKGQSDGIHPINSLNKAQKIFTSSNHCDKYPQKNNSWQEETSEYNCGFSLLFKFDDQSNGNTNFSPENRHIRNDMYNNEQEHIRNDNNTKVEQQVVSQYSKVPADTIRMSDNGNNTGDLKCNTGLHTNGIYYEQTDLNRNNQEDLPNRYYNSQRSDLEEYEKKIEKSEFSLRGRVIQGKDRPEFPTKTTSESMTAEIPFSFNREKEYDCLAEERRTKQEMLNKWRHQQDLIRQKQIASDSRKQRDQFSVMSLKQNSEKVQTDQVYESKSQPSRYFRLNLTKSFADLSLGKLSAGNSECVGEEGNKEALLKRARCRQLMLELFLGSAEIFPANRNRMKRSLQRRADRNWMMLDNPVHEITMGIPSQENQGLENPEDDANNKFLRPNTKDLVSSSLDGFDAFDENDNEALISFSNPNYGLDALNSNLLTPSSTCSSSSAQYDPETGALIHSLSSTSIDNTPSQSGHQTSSFSSAQPSCNNLNVLVSGTLRPGGKHEVAPSEGSDEDSDCYSDLSADERPGPEVEKEETDDAGEERRGSSKERSAVLERNRLAPSKTGSATDYKNSSAGHGIYSPDSNDSGIQPDRSTRCLVAGVTSASKVKDGKTQESKISDLTLENSASDSLESQVDVCEENLSVYGWEKHEDPNGAYYWHIKSGTIQREPPTDAQLSLSRQTSQGEGKGEELCLQSGRGANDDGSEGSGGAAKRENTNTSRDSGGAGGEGFMGAEGGGLGGSRVYPLRFAVRSLGWIEMSEEDLTPEKSSRSVNRCIIGLALGKNDINDAVGRWGDGKNLYMELDEENLALIDPQDLSILNIQSIQSIRVWGVGRSNGRDFAYVARDHVTRKHMCHVFRCDGLARHIAAVLRDICKRILAERGAKTDAPRTASGGEESGDQRSRSGSITRPNNLPNLGRVNGPPDGQHITFESLFKNTSFPTPMEEPKKILKCHYLGTTQVNKSTGVDTLNNAMDKVYMSQPPAKWVYVSVAVAPSTITITEHGKSDNVFAECRVRFLSFMGIAMNNARLCAFIMHCAQDQFTAHVFHCDPSAGALCKTIEAACKLRYQKCLDAHQRYRRPLTSADSNKSTRQSKGLGSSIKQGVQSVLGNFAKGCKPSK